MSPERDLTPRAAMERWIDKQRSERAESTISTYHYRLKLFVEWCEEEGIDSLWSVTGWTLETYDAHRRSKSPETITLEKEYGTVKQWLEYCARIEICDADLPEKLEVPKATREERSSDVKLDAADAQAQLEHFRNDPERFGSRGHALLELTWHVGARAGAIAGLDLRDVDETDDGTRYLSFHHRPETGTPLKKGLEGERAVILSPEVWDAIDTYVEHHRRDAEDDFGRQPLLTSRVGRAQPGTIRDWMYLATQPCLRGPCPHDKDRASCEWTVYSRASQCPSSRAPHHVRTGSITWMRNRGTPLEVVADRVNSSPETIKEHYDKEDPVAEMIERRAAFTSDLDIDSESDDSQTNE